MDITAEGLVRELQELAGRLGQTSVTRRRFLCETGRSQNHVLKHFDGWNALVRAAGLQPQSRRHVPDDELFRAMQQTFLAERGICTRIRFQKVNRYDESLYRRRGWGNWRGILRRFREWVITESPDFPYLQSLPTDSPPASRLAGASLHGRAYGALLNFRGLRHAPLNENGVVHLFGMVGLELGYTVESITPGFPDCEAKRRLKQSPETWERVRIEFEYASRSFLAHGHDPTACDLIVCWDHNWPECPLEVLELKTAIRELAE